MDMRMRRIGVAAVGAVMALAVLPAALAASGQSEAGSGLASTTLRTPATGAQPAAGDLPASGQQFAAQVLSAAPLPPGAQPWTATPPSVLAQPPLTIGSGDLSDIDALYLVDEAAGPSMSEYVLTEVGAGATVLTTGSTSGPSGSTVMFEVSMPTAGPNQSSAQLLYATTQLPDGDYLLRIDAQVVWVPGRSPSDAIPEPAGAQLTGYAAISAMNSSTGPVTVQLGEADSLELADAINALPIAAPAMCMENSLLSTITFYPMSGVSPAHVQEWLCPKLVQVSFGGAQPVLLNDGACSVIRLVAGLLPEQAAGTRGAVQYC
jgi:hypothetical protein